MTVPCNPKSPFLESRCIFSPRTCWCQELEPRRDIVDVLLNMGGNVVFITSDVTFTGRKVLIMVVFGLKNAF